MELKQFVGKTIESIDEKSTETKTIVFTDGSCFKIHASHDNVKPFLETEIVLRQQRRPNFAFSELGITIGSVLHFVDNYFITATVVDDKHINFGGEITTTTGAAKKILKDKTTLQGTLYWMYEEETLDARRTRLEKESIII